MGRPKKQHLKRRKDGYFVCRYKDQWFYSLISEDEEKKYNNDIQKWTDDATKKVDDQLAAKEKDIMQV